VSENLDLVRSILKGWQHADFSRADWADPEIDWEFVGGPEPSGGTGIVALATAVRRWIQAWDDWRVTVDEYRELDHERILVLCHAAGRGKTSGVQLEEMFRSGGAMLFEVRGEKIKRFVVYWGDREPDLRAPGEI
jgi:ketosteroid isomerase-like protein